MKGGYLMGRNLRFVTILSALVLLGLILNSAFGQGYPNKPIRLVVATGPGGGEDIVARAIWTPLGERLGKPIVIDNRPGGGGIVAADIVAKTAPDGYTLLTRSTSFAIDSSRNLKLPYDPIKAFEPIILMCFSPYILSVHPSVPVKSVKELIVLAKSKPGQLNYGSSGVGSITHLSGEMFKYMTGIEMVHVPYTGGPAAVTGLLRGEVNMLSITQALVLPHHKAGRLRCLAALGTKRTKAMPELPTMEESGLPGYNMIQWYGVFAPAGTPKEIVNKLNYEILKSINLPEVQKRLGSEYELAGSSPEEFKSFFSAEIKKWAKLIKGANIVID
jgi:tripartite-type tricarboxylate transporter receptor subunit TctC